MSWHSILCLALIGLTCYPSPVTTQVVRASYGESCNATHRCSRRDWLTCNEGVCSCLKPDVMVYENVSDLDHLRSPAAPEEAYSARSRATAAAGRCVVKVSEMCQFNLGNDASSTPLYETFPCSKNSICDSQGFCSCRDGYYENLNESCVQFQEFMEPCSTDLKCKKGLECVDERCICDADIVQYSTTLKRCVGLAGSTCNDGFCVENATCHANDRVCNCDYGYFQNDQNSCVPVRAYGEECQQDDHCGKDPVSDFNLVCHNGKCTCDSNISIYSRVSKHKSYKDTDVYKLLEARIGQNYFEYYEEDPPKFYRAEDDHSFNGFETQVYSLCAPKPGKSCPMTLCSPTSFCKISTRTCTCMDGTEVSRLTGLCGKSFGGKCKASDDECVDGLVCKTPGTCQCRYSRQVYDSSSKRCISEVNDPCVENSDCRGNAECVKKGYGHLGRCKCKSGYILDGRNGCRASFNTTCGYENGECDSLAGLVCVKNKCVCKDTSIYSEKLQQCLGMVGTLCNLNETESSCVEGASCKCSRTFLPSVHNRPDVTAYCACNDGLIETDDFMCASPQALSTNEGSLDRTVREVENCTSAENLPTPVPTSS